MLQMRIGMENFRNYLQSRHQSPRFQRSVYGTHGQITMVITMDYDGEVCLALHTILCVRCKIQATSSIFGFGRTTSISIKFSVLIEF